MSTIPFSHVAYAWERKILPLNIFSNLKKMIFLDSYLKVDFVSWSDG